MSECRVLCLKSGSSTCTPGDLSGAFKAERKAAPNQAGNAACTPSCRPHDPRIRPQIALPRVTCGCWIVVTCLIFIGTTVVPSQAQRRAPTVGILNYAAAGDVRVVQFLTALRELGYIEGRNIALVQRHADGA